MPCFFVVRRYIRRWQLCIVNSTIFCNCTDMKKSLVRPYLGKSAEERITERRRRLIDTAFELLSSDGWKQVTIDKLCRQAKLNKRYFYESFSNLDELAVAVVNELSSALVNIGIEAALEAQKKGLPTDDLARNVIGAVIKYLTDDPNRARVLFTEISDSPQAMAHRKVTINRLAQVLSAYGHQHHNAPDTFPIAELGSALLVGGSIEAILRWLDGNINMSREAFIDDLAALWVLVGDGAADRERARLPDQDGIGTTD